TQGPQGPPEGRRNRHHGGGEGYPLLDRRQGPQPPRLRRPRRSDHAGEAAPDLPRRRDLSPAQAPAGLDLPFRRRLDPRRRVRPDCRNPARRLPRPAATETPQVDAHVRIGPSSEESRPLADTEQRYNLCRPNLSGSFSIQSDRIPPVQARSRCPHCKEPMDFPSREEARAYVRLQAEAGGVVASATPAPAAGETKRPSRETPAAGDSTGGADAARFPVEKPGFQTDLFDRRGLRNLIRTGEVLETDKIRVDDSAPIAAGDLPYLVSLFKMAREQKAKPPACCRTHTERVAFFKCND